MASQVTSVSGERIAEELRKLFAASARASGVDSLVQSGLWAAIMPEAKMLSEETVAALAKLGDAPTISLGLAALMDELPATQLDAIADRLRLSNAKAQ